MDEEQKEQLDRLIHYATDALEDDYPFEVTKQCGDLELVQQALMALRASNP